MMYSIASWVLTMCIDGIMICERNTTPPTLKFYEQGKACYVQGVFYSSCPAEAKYAQ